MKEAFVDLTPLRTVPLYRRLWFGQTLSGLGAQMTLVAVLYQVWDATGSTVWTGLVGLAQAVPLIVFGLSAGALVDRRDRRLVYLAAMTGQAVCSLLLAAQAVLGDTPIAVVLAIVAVQACFGSAGAPAARTFLSRLLPPERLGAGLALTRIGFQGAMLVGPALGGVLAGTWGVGVCYAVDAVTFCAALYCARALPSGRQDGAAARPGLRGVLDGIAFLVGTPVVRAALLTDLAATVLSMPISVFPLINAERFGDDPRALGVLLTAVAVGGVTASALSGTFTRRSRPTTVMYTGAAAWGLALTALAFVSSPVATLACLVVAGAADTVSVVSRSTVVQLHTPDALLGRASAAEGIVGRAGPELGNLRGGLVAGVTNSTVALAGGGLACVAAVLLIAVSTRRRV